MYLFSRTESFVKLFCLLSICGLIMYAAIAFYTFNLIVIKVNTNRQQLERYPGRIGNEILGDADFKLKYILLWTTPDFRFNLTTGGQKILVNNNCEHLNCYITTNKTLFDSNSDVKKFDAIVFSISTLKRWNKYFPKERSPNQKYVFYSTLPAKENPVCSVEADSFFNWTWTYKLYSDIPSPFIEVKDLTGNIVAPRAEVEWPDNFDYESISSYVNTKPKAIMWHDENCNNEFTDWFAKELQRNLLAYSLVLDIYGCKHKKCPIEGCLKAIEKYSFYLVFELSTTDDFVTKEVLKGFRHNAVPVVVGETEYNKFLPPGSYIDSGRGETPESLANLLDRVLKNPFTYNSFFLWKNHYTIGEANIQKGYCKLCALLNNKKRMQTLIPYMFFRKWWYSGDLHEKCNPKMNSNSKQSLLKSFTVKNDYYP